jgi:hypothetical protein
VRQAEVRPAGSFRATAACVLRRPGARAPRRPGCGERVAKARGLGCPSRCRAASRFLRLCPTLLHALEWLRTLAALDPLGAWIRAAADA